MTAELRSLLEEQRKGTDQWQRESGTINPWVFTYKGKPFKSYKRSWATACRKAGLAGMIPHDFRRTAVRNLVRAGIPERVAMQMTGHKTRAVFERYNIVSASDLKAAMDKLDTMGATVKATGAD
jgi:integrase